MLESQVVQSLEDLCLLEEVEDLCLLEEVEEVDVSSFRRSLEVDEDNGVRSSCKKGKS